MRCDDHSGAGRKLENSWQCVGNGTTRNDWPRSSLVESKGLECPFPQTNNMFNDIALANGAMLDSHWSTVFFAISHDRPSDPGSFVSKGHRHHVEGTPVQQLCYPGIYHLMDTDAMNGCSGTMYQQFANISVAPLTDAAQTLLCPRRVLLRYQPKPSRKMSGRGELLRMIDGRRQGGGSEWADTRHLHKTADKPRCRARLRGSPSGAFNLDLKIFDLVDKD